MNGLDERLRRQERTESRLWVGVACMSFVLGLLIGHVA